MLRFLKWDHNQVWDNQRLQQRLSHYYRLLHDKTTALYLRCKTIPADFTVEESTTKLWEKHAKLKLKFELLLNSHPNGVIDKPNDEFIEPPPPVIGPSFLDLKGELAKRMLGACEFCENLCRVNRAGGKIGFCGVPAESFVSSSFLHMGEEPPLVPSGTIFFAGCSFDCCFCQNDDISEAGKRFPIQSAGRKVDPPGLAEIAEGLAEQGAININYVGGDPTPSLYTILASLMYQEANICQLWNSNLYNSLHALELLSDVIDLWLPDLKYGNNTCALTHSRIKNYWDIMQRNFKFINTHGTKNIIIRHLVLPGHFECCTKPILEWIGQAIPNVVVNIMAQYHPENKVSDQSYPDLNRKVSRAEMQKAYDIAEALGIEFRSVS